MNLLIADDEPDTLELLVAHFRAKGYEVAAARDGESAVRQFRLHKPDLVLLDVRMPQLNGWGVLEQVRRSANVPVILISALDSAEDAVKGFGLGADDYIRKPFDLRELDARVQAVMRRRGLPEEGSVVRAGPVEIDDDAKTVRLEGRIISLSPREYGLLKLLAETPGRVFSHQEIIERVWPPENRADTSDVKQYVHLLRSKVEHNPGRPALVKTVKGFGYKFVLAKGE
jgi:DNA-binding response OmpR family regulator